MPSSWTVVEPSLPALTFTYSFGPGIANALALVTGGGVVLVSPPCNPTEETFKELEAKGPLKAFVAPNAFHHMGLPAWKKRYPDVPVFAPAQSIARIGKKSGMNGLQPLADAAKLLGDGIELVDMPHYKTGEVLVRWKIAGGWAWWMCDIAMNLQRENLKGPFGLVFRWTKSGPGFRRNAIAGAFMVKDKRSLYGWIVEQAKEKPPKSLFMCHGDHVHPADPVGEVQAAFA